MKFIFPQNSNFKSKMLGIIDYTTAILNVIIAIILFCIVNVIFSSINIKIFVFIVVFFPVFLFSIIGFNGENIIAVCNYLLKYIFKPKILLYKK